MASSSSTSGWKHASWAFLADFSWNEPDDPVPDWGGACAMAAARLAYEAPLWERLGELLAAASIGLAGFGADPLETDWTRFRPLKRDREERWSDWLAHLLEHSTTGVFASLLFGRTVDTCQRPEVHRELVIGGARLDLRVAWSDGASSHVEVKTGDLCLEKTFPTAQLHREYIGHSRCDDWILLPPEHLARWHRVEQLGAAAFAIVIRAVTWRDVATALRKALTHSGETLPWKVWAWTLVGCIEQDLLHFPRLVNGVPVGGGAALSQLLAYLEDCQHE